MKQFLYFPLMPLDIQNFTISLMDEKYVFNLVRVSKYFSENVMRLCLKSIGDEESGYLGNEKLSKFDFVESLHVGFRRCITDETMRKLTNLSQLSLSENERITDSGLLQLTNLTHLDISFNHKITDSSLTCLTNLKCLFIWPKNEKITDSGIIKLTKLTNLYMMDLRGNIKDLSYKLLV